MQAQLARRRAELARAKGESLASVGISTGQPDPTALVCKYDEHAHRSGNPAECDPAEVIPGLWVGTARVMPRGVTHVVSIMCSDPGVTAGLAHLHVPLEDNAHDADLKSQLERTAVMHWIDSAIGGGGVCLVHCVEGISRAPAMCMAFLVICRGYKLLEAYRCVRASRPVARPNRGFMIQLIEIEVTCHGSATMQVEADGLVYSEVQHKDS